MRGNKLRIVIFGIIGLAAIGVISSLINNPSRFVMGLLFTAAIAVVIFMIFSFIMKKRYSPETNSDMRKYKRAVKQSQLKYSQQTSRQGMRQRPAHSSAKLTRKRRRRAPHLTVIDGRKKES